MFFLSIKLDLLNKKNKSAVKFRIKRLNEIDQTDLK